MPHVSYTICFFLLFRRAPAVAVGLVLVLALAACATSKGPLVTAEAQADEWLTPGEGRAQAVTEATRLANRQMIELVRAEPSGLGGTVGDLMDGSAYVTARVRLAVARCKTKRSSFHTDGRAVVARALDMRAVISAACAAAAESR